jgi:pimeloyl-ACP methyl ester carboxylesterase
MTQVAQLTPHHAERVELDGRYGPVAALRTPDPAPATVLLVPGYTGSKEDFAPLLDPIAAAGFRAMAIDLPGQYESGGPDDEPAYLPGPLGEVVASLVDGLGGPVVLLGHSYGGLVARGAVLAGAPVTGLVLMDTGPQRLPYGMRWDALNVGEPLLRDDGIDAAYVERERVNARFPAWAKVPVELKTFYRKRFVSSSPAGLLGMAHGLRTEPDLVDELTAALDGRPCLVVAGENDDAWSVPDQRVMAERLGAAFALVPNAAHSPNTENPAGLGEILLSTWRGWLGPTRSEPPEDH